MSTGLVVLVMIIYAGVSINEALHGNPGACVMFAGYAFANIGIILMGLS